MEQKLLDFEKILRDYVQQTIAEVNRNQQEDRMNNLFKADTILGNK